MAGPAQPVPFVPSRPGVSKRASGLSLGDRWTDSDKAQFVDGKPEKLPGFIARTLESVTDAIRGILAWTTLDFIPMIGIGTHRKLYVIDYGNVPFDITPVESTGELTDPFTTEDGSSIVTVEHTSHGRQVGDEVRYADAIEIPLSGVTVDGTYEVVGIIDEDNYTIEHSSVATADATGGGTVAYEYELSIGSTDPLLGDGYGAGGYGLGDYGEPSEETVGGLIFEPRVWHLEAYGDLMLANPVNGGIYQFDPDATPAYQRAEIVSGAPTVCRGIFVSEERILFALGVDNDPMKVKWADQDDITEWTPGALTTANSRRLREGSRLISGCSLGRLLAVIWSDTAFYRFQYTGSEFIYDSVCMGTNAGLVSPMAKVVVRGTAYWQAPNDFLMSNGGAPVPIPNAEDVREYVLRALRVTGYEYKCNACYSPRYNTVMFLYVAGTATEPGLYAMVSLNDFAWVVGTLERTSSAYFKFGDQRPMMASADGWLYQHEDGLDADGEIMQAHLTRAPMQILNGGRLGEVESMVNDMQRQTGTMSVEVAMYDRLGEGVLDKERTHFEPDENLIDIGIGGRIAAITIRSAALGGDFRLGEPVLLVKATGSRR